MDRNKPVTVSKYVKYRTLEDGTKIVYHDYGLNQLPEPKPAKSLDSATYDTFLFTMPAVHPESEIIRRLERDLTEVLQGGFTQWLARGAWNGPNGHVFEDVRVYLVSTDKEKTLRRLVKSVLNILGEKEGYFVRVGEHAIL